jgi:hypothetical protein
MAYTRRITLEEGARIPLDGLLLGWGAMVPLAVSAALAFRPDLSGVAVEAGRLWAAAIAVFLAGVRRGLSFRTAGGPRARQLAMMLWLFLGGIAAAAMPLSWALWLLIALYLSLAVLDPIAARAGDVPLYFARLRPAQMGFGAVCLGVMAVGAWGA